MPNASRPHIAAGCGSSSSSRSSLPSREGVTVASAPSSTAANASSRVVLLDLEAQPRRVADEPQQPRGVVEERAVVQHAQPPRREVLERVRHRLQLPVREPHRDRVDGEVAAREVFRDRRAELDLRQRTRLLVALAPRGGEVDDAVRGRRPEALVQQRLLPQPPRDLGGVALHHQIEVPRVAAEQRVAHRAAHDPDARDVFERVEQLPRAGDLPQPLEQVVVHVPATIAPHVAAG